jgi:hypothetical protein
MDAGFQGTVAATAEINLLLDKNLGGKRETCDNVTEAV